MLLSALAHQVYDLFIRYLVFLSSWLRLVNHQDPDILPMTYTYVMFMVEDFLTRKNMIRTGYSIRRSCHQPLVLWIYLSCQESEMKLVQGLRYSSQMRRTTAEGLC